MTSPSTGSANSAQLRIIAGKITHVQITGPTEAAVLHKAGDFMARFDDAVILSFSWRGNISDVDEHFLWAMDMTLDMDLAEHTGQWPDPTVD